MVRRCMAKLWACGTLKPAHAASHLFPKVFPPAHTGI